MEGHNVGKAHLPQIVELDEYLLKDLDEIDDFSAAACCGTAAVITWIERIVDAEREWKFPFDERWQKLYDVLVGIQTGKEEDPFGWRYEISV